jgi:hypothetical protein
LLVAGFALVALVAGGGGPPGPRLVAAASEVHHAAVVIDTGDGVVRKMCLAFPEEEIEGIEALRRVDTRPYRFEQFGTNGAAVCMLCGVGCPGGDCFCDPGRYWAYHRAGPGGERYVASRVGASSTRVRDGDVEGWRWGTGAPPPAATVGEVCDVDEPPARTSAATTTSTKTPDTTTTTPADLPPGPDPVATSTPTTTRVATRATTTTEPGAPAPTTAPPSPPAAAADDPTPVAGAADGGGEIAQAPAGARRPTTPPPPRATGTGPLPFVVFAGLLAAMFAWRFRLRRLRTRP